MGPRSAWETADQPVATFSKMAMQHSPKMFCNFRQKGLAKNNIHINRCVKIIHLFTNKKPVLVPSYPTSFINQINLFPNIIIGHKNIHISWNISRLNIIYFNYLFINFEAFPPQYLLCYFFSFLIYSYFVFDYLADTFSFYVIPFIFWLFCSMGG